MASDSRRETIGIMQSGKLIVQKCDTILNRMKTLCTQPLSIFVL
jgi:hypothetical protein